MNVFVRPHHTRTSTYMSVFARQTQKCNRHQIVYVCVCVCCVDWEMFEYSKLCPIWGNEVNTH